MGRDPSTEPAIAVAKVENVLRLSPDDEAIAA